MWRASARLMNSDEAATLRLLTSHRATTDRLIASYRGRIANTAGDSILAEFPSAVDALRCSLDVQDRLAGLNEQVPEERRVQFRIGLHVGEIMVRAGDLFGDGVNIAARMQALAPPGTVCLSETAFQFAHRSVDCHFAELGPQVVKNIELPVTAYLASRRNEVAPGAIPTVHRRILFHLARRFQALCDAALFDVVGSDGLKPIEYCRFGVDRGCAWTRRSELAERLGITARQASVILAHLRHSGW